MKLSQKRKKSPLSVATSKREESVPRALTPDCSVDMKPSTPLLPKPTASLSVPRASEVSDSSARSSPDRVASSASIDMSPPTSQPLIPKPGTRARKNPMPRYVPTDWDDSLPYGGKVYLARKKKPDSWLCIFIQVALVAFAFGLIYYAWYHTEHMHFHAAKIYAHLGHVHAQAITAEKYLYGKGVDADHSQAMLWMKKAADQGHPHASYNLAVSHIQGHDVGLKPGDAHRLIKHAADNGVPEAQAAAKVCAKTGQCDT